MAGSDINSVTLVGRLTRDPEVRTTTSGLSICKLGIANNEAVKNGVTNEWEEKVSFIDVVVFGGQAESCGRYLEKGRSVGIQGRLRQNRWETDSGEKRSRIEVVANRVQFLSDGKGSGERRETGGYESDVPIDTRGVEPEFRPTHAAADDVDEIPF